MICSVTPGKYDDLDHAILTFIGNPKAATGLRGAKATAGEMMSYTSIALEAGRLAIETGPVSSSDHKPAFRFLDGRLQALKRAGKIRYSGPRDGWEMVKRRTL
jgi:hypothetical protein